MATLAAIELQVSLGEIVRVNLVETISLSSVNYSKVIKFAMVSQVRRAIKND